VATIAINGNRKPVVREALFHDQQQKPLDHTRALATVRVVQHPARTAAAWSMTTAWHPHNAAAEDETSSQPDADEPLPAPYAPAAPIVFAVRGRTADSPAIFYTAVPVSNGWLIIPL
jgi:hypothetical protein